MKILFFLLFTFSVYSQNTYIFIEKPKSLLEKALETKQSRYDANIERMFSAIADIKNKVNDLNKSDEFKEAVLYDFNNYLGQITKARYDYSSNSITLQVINSMYDKVNNIIKSKKLAYKQIKAKVLSSDKYQGGYTAMVKEYQLKNGKWEVINLDARALFYFNGNMIWFKRSNGDWRFRELKFDSYDSHQKMHAYKTDYGDVYIDDKFNNVILFEEQNGRQVKMYDYEIGNYDDKINPEQQ